jgi:tetratricopeptide (TPR) repeat protein
MATDPKQPARGPTPRPHVPVQVPAVRATGPASSALAPPDGQENSVPVRHVHISPATPDQPAPALRSPLPSQPLIGQRVTSASQREPQKVTPTPGESEHAARGRSMRSEFRKGKRDETTLFGVPVPFTGRRADLEAIYNAVRGALNNRQVGVLWVHGQPGVGKSRLLAELARVVEPRKRGVTWYRVVAGVDRSGPPTLCGRVLLELVGGFDVLHGRDPWGDVQRALVGLVGTDNAKEAMVAVGPLVGLRKPDDSQEFELPLEAPRDVAAQFVAGLVRHKGKQAPVVVHVDASLAASPEVEGLVAALQKALQQTAAAVLVDASGPPVGLGGVTVHEVQPLDEDGIALLVKNVTQRVRDVPAELTQQLMAHSGGLPERVLDLVRGMLAAGEIVQEGQEWRWKGRTERGGAMGWGATGTASKSQLPDSIARLPADLREIVDACAIFGPVTWFGGVLSVLRGGRHDPAQSLGERDRVSLKAGMMQLQAIDVLVFVENSKMSKELEFAFVQPTDPAAIVAEMDGEKRTLYARLAAQWLNSKPRQDPVADHARIAELYELGDRTRMAAQAYLEAGNAARAVGQTQRAVALYDAGSRNAGTDDADLACELRTAHGGSLLRLSRPRDAEAVLLDALHMARCLDDDARCGVVQLRVAQVARVSGRYESALEFLEGALKHLKVAAEHRWIADVSDEMGLVHMVQGGHDAYKHALQHFLKALALRRRSQDKRVVARSLCHIARVHTGRGHFDDALEAVNEAVQICDQIQEPWGAAEARTVLGEVHAAAGRYQPALQAWEVATDLAHKVGDRGRKLEVTILRAETFIALGDWQHAAALMLDSLEVAKEINDPEMLSGIYRVQAAISLERTALETADLDSERAVAVARESGARVQVARALLVRACVLGTRALTEKGARSTVIDRRCTECFEEALDAFRTMGDLVRLQTGLRSYAAYLSHRGGGPRLAQVQVRLKVVEDEMVRVVG